MYFISAKTADKISDISNDFDTDYDQDFLKISDSIAKRISKLGFRVFNNLNSADTNYSNINSVVVKLSKGMYFDCIQFLFLVKFINDNHLDTVDTNDLHTENKAIKAVLSKLLNLKSCNIESSALH